MRVGNIPFKPRVLHSNKPGSTSQPLQATSPCFLLWQALLSTMEAQLAPATVCPQQAGTASQAPQGVQIAATSRVR